jgi:histidinol phosphatase-like enzyme
LLDRIEVCFDAGGECGEPCTCRNPTAGMLLYAAEALDIAIS